MYVVLPVINIFKYLLIQIQISSFFQEAVDGKALKPCKLFELFDYPKAMAKRLVLRPPLGKIYFFCLEF